jgi:hypothetical protein
MSSFKNDLLNLEINTIVKDRIGALKMPAPLKALEDIFYEYDEKIKEINKTIQAFSFSGLIYSYNVEEKNDIEGDKLKVYLIEVKNKAIALESQLKSDGLNESQSSVFMDDNSNKIDNMRSHLRRIITNIKQIENLKSYRNILNNNLINKKDLVQLRKIWEIGTEDIVMQTVIQIDGDVVTRIIPEYATNENSALHKFHELGVNVSLKYWGSLIELARKLLGTVLERLTWKV